MTSSILTRIEQRLGFPGLVDRLSSGIPQSDLTSLLMEVCRRRAERLTPAQVLARYRDDVRCAPASSDPRALQRLIGLAFDCLPDSMSPIDPAPVAPLGACSVFSAVPQHNVLSTIRALEVMADPTNALALECALRRRATKKEGRTDPAPISLACAQRVLRMQFRGGAGVSPHFSLLALVTAGRDRGAFAFEAQALGEHLEVLLALLQRLPEIGRAPVRAHVLLSDFAGGLDSVLDGVRVRLAGSFPDASIELDPSRTRSRGYYQTAAFDVRVVGASGEALSVADGGFTDWTARLLDDRKERYLISGLGLDRVLLATQV